VHPKIQAKFFDVIKKSGIRPERALEFGGYLNEKSLLISKEVGDAERYCLNLVDLEPENGIIPVTGNGNDMHMFEDDSFDLVVSNATLEHDKYFWRSLAEMRRVTRPGGMLIIGVPGFIRNKKSLIRNKKSLPRRGTITFEVHYHFDYYRFSKQAVREVFFEGMEDVEVIAMLKPPRLIGHGRKPLATASRDAAPARAAAPA
jgi:SAM-dependent methyltransferase